MIRALVLSALIGATMALAVPHTAHTLADRHAQIEKAVNGE